MRWLVVLILGVMPYPVPAAQSLLVPVLAPVPDYPAQLIENRYAGKVRARLIVKSDGSIAEVRIIESMHPALATAVEKTFGQWRFEPWAHNLGAPPQIAVTLPVIFGSQGLARFDSLVNVGLGNIRCAYVNYEVSAQQQHFPHAPMSHVDVFWYTRQFLHDEYVALRHDERERQALLGKLETAIPGIVKGCRQRPQSRYGDHLPPSIRQLLVGVDEPVERQEAS